MGTRVRQVGGATGSRVQGTRRARASFASMGPMDTVVTADIPEAIGRLAAAATGLRWLVLYGSRGRGDGHGRSDWDFAYETDTPIDPDVLLADLGEAVKANRVDLVDVARAGALLRHRIARDGRLLFQRNPGQFDRFRLDAIHTWCDLAPVLEPLYAHVLEVGGA